MVVHRTGAGAATGEEHTSGKETARAEAAREEATPTSGPVASVPGGGVLPGTDMGALAAAKEPKDAMAAGPAAPPAKPSYTPDPDALKEAERPKDFNSKPGVPRQPPTRPMPRPGTLPPGSTEETHAAALKSEFGAGVKPPAAPEGDVKTAHISTEGGQPREATSGPSTTPAKAMENPDKKI